MILESDGWTKLVSHFEMIDTLCAINNDSLHEKMFLHIMRLLRNAFSGISKELKTILWATDL